MASAKIKANARLKSGAATQAVNKLAAKGGQKVGVGTRPGVGNSNIRKAPSGTQIRKPSRFAAPAKKAGGSAGSGG